MVLGWQLYYHGDWSAWTVALREAWRAEGSAWWLLAAVLLMPLNWLLESIKWRGLLREYWPATWPEVWRAVLAGISVSLATPNRIGEYGGRLLVLPAERMGAVVWTTLVGSLCQWLVFLLLGWPALVGVVAAAGHWPVPFMLAPAALGPLIALLLPLFWDRLMIGLRASRRLASYRHWRWLRRKLKNGQRIQGRHLRLTLGWAALRYLVYTVQYYLLLRFFGLSIGWLEGLTGISAIYMLQAGLPLPPGLGVFTRSELALWLWGAKVVHPAGIVAATLTLFVLNLAIPALLGTSLIVKTNEVKSPKYANETS